MRNEKDKTHPENNQSQNLVIKYYKKIFKNQMDYGLSFRDY